MPDGKKEIEYELPKIGRKKLRLNARRIYEHGVPKDRMLLAIYYVAEKE